ncbi:MAG: MoaD/ThiS family protein [Desulfurococcaceae archaeon]
MIKVRILESNKTIEINEKEVKVSELLRRLGLSSSEIIVIKNNNIVTEEDVLVDNDEVTVFTVKSGG